MAEVKPFRALRFNEARVGSYSDVVTPPFDVISPNDREILARKSPFNMVRLILPRAEGNLTPYETAAKYMESWIHEGILQQDSQESFYLLEQTFQGLDHLQHVRRGFYAVVKLPEPGERRTVLDHERTFETKVRDRLALTEATQANLGAVFVLYEDPDKELGPFLDQMRGRPADMTAQTIDGVSQRVWRVPGDDRITAFFKGKTLYIADGHHRFRTAMLYRDKMRERHPGGVPQPYDYVLLGFVAFNDPGLVVWPTHRLLDPPDGFDPGSFLAKMETYFDVKVLPEGCRSDVLVARISQGGACTLGLAIHNFGRFLLTLRDVDRTAFLGDDRSPTRRELDVAVLHRGIIEGMLGIKEGAELVYDARHDTALARLDSGEKKLAFFLKAIPPSQVKACAEAGVYMPEKATYFFPKIPSGAVIHRLTARSPQP